MGDNGDGETLQWICPSEMLLCAFSSSCWRYLPKDTDWHRCFLLDKPFIYFSLT